MRAYWQLTRGQLILFVRNRQMLFWSLLFPVFLMVMLGSFIGGGGTMSVSGEFIDEDRTNASQQLIEALQIQGDSVNAALTKAEDKQEALKKLSEGQLTLVLIIPSGYQERLDHDGDAATLQLYTNETSLTASEIGKMYVNTVADTVSKAHVGYEPVIAVESIGVKSVELSYIDFLVPGIVAMMIMSNNMNGVAAQISSWRERGVLRRMQGTPLSASTFIMAQITARLLLNGLQAFLVLFIAALFFDTQVRGSWLLLIFFVILGTLAFMAIGFIIAGIAKTPESAGPIAGFLSFPLLFLGGVFFPISNMPEIMQPFVKLLPISHLSTALREIMNVGAGMTEIWYDAALLGAWAVAAFLIASRTFRWE